MWVFLHSPIRLKSSLCLSPQWPFDPKLPFHKIPYVPRSAGCTREVAHFLIMYFFARPFFLFCLISCLLFDPPNRTTYGLHHSSCRTMPILLHLRSSCSSKPPWWPQRRRLPTWTPWQPPSPLLRSTRWTQWLLMDSLLPRRWPLPQVSLYGWQFYFIWFYSAYYYHIRIQKDMLYDVM